LVFQIAADNPAHPRIDWFVTDVRSGGAVLEIRGQAPDLRDRQAASDVLQLTVSALADLESGAEIKRLLSYQALERAGELADLLYDGVSAVSVSGFGREVPVTAKGADRARELLGRRYRSHGSVEGTIETVSIHETRPYFIVFHALDGHAIKCLCDRALLERVKENLGPRVLVEGTLERRFDGRVEVIDAADFQRLRERSELPQAAEVRGILNSPRSVGTSDG
jgi:hypothetical protein